MPYCQRQPQRRFGPIEMTDSRDVIALSARAALRVAESRFHVRAFDDEENVPEIQNSCKRVVAVSWLFEVTGAILATTFITSGDHLAQKAPDILRSAHSR